MARAQSGSGPRTYHSRYTCTVYTGEAEQDREAEQIRINTLENKKRQQLRYGEALIPAASGMAWGVP